MVTRGRGDTSGQPSVQPTVFRFSTDDFPERDRLAIWHDIVGRTVCNLAIDPLGDTSYRADATVSKYAGLGVLVGKQTSARLSHTKELIVDDDLSFLIGQIDQWQAIQHGRETWLTTGDGVLMNNAEAGSITLPSQTQFVTFRVPLAGVAPLVPDFAALIARRVPAHSPALRLLARYFEALQEEAAPATLELQRLVETHVCDLLALALGATHEAAEIAKGRGVRAARLQVVLAEIKLHFSDPKFSLADVARKLGVSIRYIQDVLFDTGMSFSERVMELRLHKARTMLVYAASPLKVIEIAYACGFGDISYFNRCFRRRFGASPSEFRNPGATAG